MVEIINTPLGLHLVHPVQDFIFGLCNKILEKTKSNFRKESLFGIIISVYEQLVYVRHVLELVTHLM